MLTCAFRNGRVLREQLKQLGLGLEDRLDDTGGLLHQRRIILDLEGAEKENHTVETLLVQFYESQGEELASDSLLLG